MVATEPVEWVAIEFAEDVPVCFVFAEELPDILEVPEPVEPETVLVASRDELDNVASVVPPVEVLSVVVPDGVLELCRMVEDWVLDWDELVVIPSVREILCVLTDDGSLEIVETEPDSVLECEETDVDDLVCVECEIRPVEEIVIEPKEDVVSAVAAEELLVCVEMRPEDFDKVGLNWVSFVVPLVF
ncbi:hypothetical protein PG985_009552 [Apiospora marii]|uniref:Uncharacterized protein n=1 Tax=Apiospora marii TaxID=335849 RepID=A0ABR1RGM2_9PEZI